MSKPRNHRLIPLADLTTTHVGRQIEVGGITGTLAGVIPLGSRVTLALLVGGARVWTDALPADTAVEIWKEPAA